MKLMRYEMIKFMRWDQRKSNEIRWNEEWDHDRENEIENERMRNQTFKINQPTLNTCTILLPHILSSLLHSPQSHSSHSSHLPLFHHHHHFVVDLVVDLKFDQCPQPNLEMNDKLKLKRKMMMWWWLKVVVGW